MEGAATLLLTAESVKDALVRAGVKWTVQLCIGGLRLRKKALEKVRNASPEEKWQYSIGYWLSSDPTPSWRRLISAVDYYDEQHEAASKLYHYAEPVAGN